MEHCFYCEENEQLYSLMLDVCELKYSKVYLKRDQKHEGRCIVAFKGHKTEVFQLSEEENRGFFAELSLVAQAVWNGFGPDKINYAIYGDGVPHFHVHVVPKYKDGPQWGSPFDDTVPMKLLSDEEYAAVISRLKEEIQKLQ